MREKLSGSKQIIAPSERERKRNAGKGSGFEGKTEKGIDALLLLLLVSLWKPSFCRHV